jgi:hypothetical protein
MQLAYSNKALNIGICCRHNSPLFNPDGRKKKLTKASGLVSVIVIQLQPVGGITQTLSIHYEHQNVVTSVLYRCPMISEKFMLKNIFLKLCSCLEYFDVVL